MNRNVGDEKLSKGEWKESQLGDVIDFGNGKSRPMTIGQTPVYGGNGVLGYCDRNNYQDETIIIGRVGAYCGSVYFENRPIWISDNALSAKPKGHNNTKFLFYMLKNLKLNQFAEGSSHPLVTQTLLNSIDVAVPINESEQRAIASVLSSLDDKIDLLHRQNKTLEAMAETLFRRWFVPFDSAQGKEVGDVKTIKLGDVIEIFDSKRIPLSSTERDKLKIGQLYPYYGAAAVMDYINQYIFDGEYLLIGEDGTVQTDDGYPVLQLATGKIWVNNHTHVIKALKPFSNFLLYTILKKTSISHIITGAVQPKINQENLKSLEIEVPDISIIENTVLSTNYYWEKIKRNNIQINILDDIRNILLPKLMSGEMRVEVGELR